ncbi:MAG TPA: hypothetical protein VN635_04830 [Conexibacter sp.]|nr:hypothetical protein [Conexibacter sp.]
MPLLFLGGFEVRREARTRSDGDDRAAVLPDALEELRDELASLGGGGLDLPEATEVGEQLRCAVELRVGRRPEAFQLLLQRLAAHDVPRLREVAHDVEVLEARELGGEVAAADAVRVGVVGRLADRLEHALAEIVIGLEGAQPVYELRLQRLGLHDWLAARVAVATCRADVAPHRRPGAARAVHPRAAALAVEELAQQVVVGRRAGLQHPRAPRAHLLHAIEQLLRHDRLVPAADLARLVAQAGDVAAIGGVYEHLAHGVLGERAALRRARALGIEPRSDRAVGLLPGGVALEHAAHERRALELRHGLTGVRVVDVAPRELADEMALARLLGEAGAGPERERDGVVLVEHLVDRLGEERGRVAGVVAHRLRDGDDANSSVTPGYRSYARPRGSTCRTTIVWVTGSLSKITRQSPTRRRYCSLPVRRRTSRGPSSAIRRSSAARMRMRTGGSSRRSSF